MNKQKKYKRLYQQIKELLEKEADVVAKMATINALLYHKIDYYFWCGFYRLINDELIIGPYQGPVACLKLEKNKGICWASVNQQNIMIVEDVHQFPGHIACDSRSKSEIVIPVQDKSGKIKAVFDVDSKNISSFDKQDAEGLQQIVSLIYY